MSPTEYEREVVKMLKKGPMRISDVKKALGFHQQSPCPELTALLKSSPKFTRRQVRDASGNFCQEWSLASPSEVEGINRYMLPWYEIMKKRLGVEAC